jgi:arsenate reductase (glutaredoxin)
VEIWHNPRCSKSRAAKSLLDDAGTDHRVRDYLTHPPTADELDDVLRRLGAEPWDVARMNEPVAAEIGLADLPRERDEWIAVLVEHPVLIQRPILLTDDGRAVIGRSEDSVRSVL